MTGKIKTKIELVDELSRLVEGLASGKLKKRYLLMRARRLQADVRASRVAAARTFSEGEGRMSEWISCSDKKPKDGEIVDTKIDDVCGVRNMQPLKRQGRLWFSTDGSMYVYYTPTHWKPVSDVG